MSGCNNVAKLNSRLAGGLIWPFVCQVYHAGSAQASRGLRRLGFEFEFEAELGSRLRRERERERGAANAPQAPLHSGVSRPRQTKQSFACAGRQDPLTPRA